MTTSISKVDLVLLHTTLVQPDLKYTVDYFHDYVESSPRDIFYVLM